MLPNIHPRTGIAYGVINANTINQDILNSISFESGIDLDYLEAQLNHVKRQGINIVIAPDQADVPYWVNINKALSDLDFDWSEFDEQFSEYSGSSFGSQYDNCITLYDTAANIVTVLESKNIVLCNKCSPCYPNAGDLNSPNPDGYETYSVPQDWLE